LAVIPGARKKNKKSKSRQMHKKWAGADRRKKSEGAESRETDGVRQR